MRIKEFLKDIDILNKYYIEKTKIDRIEVNKNNIIERFTIKEDDNDDAFIIDVVNNTYESFKKYYEGRLFVVEQLIKKYMIDEEGTTFESNSAVYYNLLKSYADYQKKNLIIAEGGYFFIVNDYYEICLMISGPFVKLYNKGIDEVGDFKDSIAYYSNNITELFNLSKTKEV
ncbi:MAG: hypothetical protein LBC06_01060 [Rickettsiales bacterium]|jgi:hypothetical protein|nr:hypothetical protein [Rickettsiales bacterium]